VAVVRAPSEAKARSLADIDFAISARVESDQDMASIPWTRPEAVRCDLVTNSSYPADGPAEILEPVRQ
jgi:hypothetical protein